MHQPCGTYFSYSFNGYFNWLPKLQNLWETSSGSHERTSEVPKKKQRENTGIRVHKGGGGGVRGGYNPPWRKVLLTPLKNFGPYVVKKKHIFYPPPLPGRSDPAHVWIQVSSMIHSARFTVTPVLNIVFCYFVLLDLKSGDERTTCAKIRVITTGRDCGSAEWIKKKKV